MPLWCPRVNESAHLFQAVKEFVGHLWRKEKKSLIASFNAKAYKVLHDLKWYSPHSPLLPTHSHPFWAVVSSPQLPESPPYLEFSFPVFSSFPLEF